MQVVRGGGADCWGSGEGSVARRWPPGQWWSTHPRTATTVWAAQRVSRQPRHGAVQRSRGQQAARQQPEAKQTSGDHSCRGRGKKRWRVGDGAAKTVTYAVALHPPLPNQKRTTAWFPAHLFSLLSLRPCAQGPRTTPP